MKLNDYDKEIVQMLADGKKVKEIADVFKRDTAEVYNIIDAVKHRNGCRSMVELVSKAFREKQIA